MEELQNLKEKRTKIKQQAELFSGKWKNDDTIWHQMLARIDKEIASIEMEQEEDLYKE